MQIAANLTLSAQSQIFQGNLHVNRGRSHPACEVFLPSSCTLEDECTGTNHLK